MTLLTPYLTKRGLAEPESVEGYLRNREEFLSIRDINDNAGRELVIFTAFTLDQLLRTLVRQRYLKKAVLGIEGMLLFKMPEDPTARLTFVNFVIDNIIDWDK